MDSDMGTLVAVAMAMLQLLLSKLAVFLPLLLGGGTD